MPFPLDEQVTALLKDADVIKVLATTDKHGIPHVILDSTITVDDNGRIVYLELIESSKTNSNLVGGIWFKRKVSVYLAKDGVSYQIKGAPVQSVICGPVFEHYYKLVRDRGGDADLSTVWIIEPEEWSNETYAYRKQKEAREHPLIGHLDRLAKS